MTIRKLSVLLTAAVLLCSISIANAAIVTFERIDDLNDGVDYIGPYQLTVDGQDYLSMCYDYKNQVNSGDKWTANIFSLDQLGSVPVYYASGDYIDRYKQAAWLFFQLVDTHDGTTRIAIQHTVWNLFNPGSTTTDNPDPWLQQAKAALKDGFPGVDLSGIRIVNSLPGADPKVQAFLINAPGLSTDLPEPGTNLMLGTALIGFGLLLRLRQRSSNPT